MNHPYHQAGHRDDGAFYSSSQNSGFVYPPITSAGVVSHIPGEDESMGLKRPRDPSPSHSETDGSWHLSFKRLKVMDGGSSCSDGDLAALSVVSVASTGSYEQQQSHYNSMTFPGQTQGQAAGQRSCERQTPTPPPSTTSSMEYQSMNSLLGSLHLQRQRQRAGDAQSHEPSYPAHDGHMPPPAPPPSGGCDQHQQQRSTLSIPSSSTPNGTYRKRVASLRIDSKLF